MWTNENVKTNSLLEGSEDQRAMCDNNDKGRERRHGGRGLGRG